MREHGHKWHQSTVARIETGRQMIRLGEIAALTEVFGVDLLARG